MTRPAHPQPDRLPAPALDRAGMPQVAQPARPLLVARDDEPDAGLPGQPFGQLERHPLGSLGRCRPQRRRPDRPPRHRWRPRSATRSTTAGSPPSIAQDKAIRASRSDVALLVLLIRPPPGSSCRAARRGAWPGRCRPRPGPARSLPARSAIVQVSRSTLSAPRALSRPRSIASSIASIPSGCGQPPAQVACPTPRRWSASRSPAAGAAAGPGPRGPGRPPPPRTRRSAAPPS